MPDRIMKSRSFEKKQEPSIVVAGDVLIDWMEVPVPPAASATDDSLLNWQTIPGVRQIAWPGGALLLAEWIRAAARSPVHSPVLKGIEDIPPEKIIHSLLNLDKFPLTQDNPKDQVYRISRLKGYAGPDPGISPSFLKICRDDPEAGVLVLDDAGNGFRDASDSFWPAGLKTGNPDWIVLKMSYPLIRGKLWDELSRKHAAKLILIVTADDLRRLGARITRRASWEHTATDLVWQMAANPALISLNQCAYLVVRFGVEGAILYRRRSGEMDTRLFYDPELGEDDFSQKCPGQMVGTGAVFTASLAAHLAEKGIENLNEAILQGLLASRKLWTLGFGNNWQDLRYPFDRVFTQPLEAEAAIKEVNIPAPETPDAPDTQYWCILNDISELGLEISAFNQVKRGKDNTLGKVPRGQFRNLITVDRSEIETLCNIRNLIGEYLDNPKITRPLCLAVFGPPGSGKSFAVTEVAKSVAPEKLARDPLEFNMSQFNSTLELMAAFHRVRDVTLEGRVPLVFFDEFDSEFNGKLGWLKYFLAPMQDGKFREGETVHPIGRSIFVFAGGTCATFAVFSREHKKDTQDPDWKFFIDAKGPDFVSRLRGYINVKGPDPMDAKDRHYMIRRAIIIRFLLKKKAPHIFNPRGECNIDPGILRALIKISSYKHGIRSIEAVIEMSMLSNRSSFEQAALPSAEQLQLHVDAEQFIRLVSRDVILGGSREELARAIHEEYLANQGKKRAEKDIKKETLVPWDQLSEEYKNTNRHQAEDIPHKLHAINCDFIPVKDRDPELITLTEEELDTLAKIEHERWVQQKFLQGWSYGKEKNEKMKTHPDLVSWEKLTDAEKQKDIDAVAAIPKYLAKKGFEIYRQK
ncbi:MAG: Ryanodine receptor Ryr [Candidatus Aminicenantes bacterium]|nr:Ryanodine receptor Ryr [Candidatus Aminicenantes bacterium]